MLDPPAQIMCWRQCPGFPQFSLWLLLILLPQQLLAAPTTAEYKLKTALIYKLTKFVEWPSPAGAGSLRNFGICVLGKDAFGSALDALEEKRALGMPIRIRRFSQSESIDRGCQVLFITKSKRAFLRSILKNLQDQPILTLSDTEDFAKQGGIIEFTRGKKRIGFKINLKRAKQSGLKIAAPLLELATVIGSSEEKREK